MKFWEKFLQIGVLTGSWLFPSLTFLFALAVIVPSAVERIDTGVRTNAAWAILLVASACGICIVVIRLRKRAAASKMEVHLLSIIAKECVSSGSWRVTLFQETVRKDGSTYLLRKCRVAERPDLSGAGLKAFPLERSVMQGLHGLDLEDTNAPPIDQKFIAADPEDNPSKWTQEQEGYVGDRAKALRMRSRAYAWRRIKPIQPGEHLHVLLFETTNNKGINRAGLENPLLDQIARALTSAHS